ncbi:hypothetical protein, partial [Chachezhania sediminis]|uniref:hypothetical protein n=1 Tax=Chachezhania sediminis TaxID=2599291 RepID=UPI001E297480
RELAESWQRAGRELAESWQRAGRELAESWQRAGRELAESWRGAWLPTGGYALLPVRWLASGWLSDLKER